MRLSGGGFGGGGGIDPRSFITPLVLVGLIFSGVLGWIFNGIFFLVFVVPLVAAPLLSWYINSNLIEGTCPECAAPAQVFKGQNGVCLSCGATMSDEQDGTGVFKRNGAAAMDDGVVEVDAVIDVEVD